MGMIGNALGGLKDRLDPAKGGIGMSDRALIFLSALNGDAKTAAAIRGRPQAEAQQAAFMGKLNGLIGGQYQDGPAPMIGAPTLAPSAAPPAADLGAMNMGLPQVQTASQPYQYQAPQKTAPAGIGDPRWLALAAQAPGAGYKMDNVLEVLKAQQPDVRFDRGYGYNGKTGGAMGGFHPDLDKGQAPVIGPDGHVTGVQNLPGAVDSAASMAGAVQGAQEAAKSRFVYPNARNQSRGSAEGSAPYDFINIPGPNGQPITISKSQAMGGAFAGQTPADAAYGTDIAKASAAQYQGLQAAGQQAPGKIAQLKQIDTLMGDFQGGKLAPTGLEIASAANSLGFKMDQKTSNVQAADALTKAIALQLRDPSSGGGMPGSMSNADRDYLNKMVPGLLQSADGRRQLIQIGVANYQRQADVATKARQWQQRFGRIDAPDASGKLFQDYLQDWSASHPLYAK